MANHGVCPWWAGYLLASPVRRLFQNPGAILKPYIRLGMTVLEPGPGMGFFTLEIARLVGPSGRVIAVDVEPRMVSGLRRRAERAGLSDRVDARTVRPDSLLLDDLPACVDFVFAFATVHEMPGAESFFSQTARVMKPDARLLLVEPAGHVGEAEFAQELAASTAAGLIVDANPSLPKSRVVLARKPPSPERQ